MKIQQIKDKLLEAKSAYYNDEPIMTDEEFDNLENELRKLSPKDNYFSLTGSQVEVTHWNKMKHVIPMTSLNKVNSEQEFKKWMEQVNGESYVILPKFDGISIEIIYSNGRILDAITRGDGVIGESILPNVIQMKGVPKIIDLKETVCVRGEIIMRQDRFDELNKKLEKLGEKQYSNKRNAASGIAKRYDGTEAEYLEVICYDIILKSSGEFTLEIEKIDCLEKLGFNKEHSLWMDNLQPFQDLCECFDNWEKIHRPKLDYDIDGMVISVNEIKKQKELGEVNGNPKGKIARKFKSKEKIGIVKEITWENGNNRRITPLIHIEPVDMGDVIVSKMTCHNIDIFNEMKLYIGCKILFKRSNDVIPTIIKVIE